MLVSARKYERGKQRLFYCAIDLLGSLAGRIEFNGVTGNSDILTVSDKVCQNGRRLSAVVGTEVDIPTTIDSEFPTISGHSGSSGFVT